MPLTETPDNPSQTPPREPVQVAPLKVRAGRYGELEQHELLQMLDAIDDERARGRFREAIYISIFVYLALTWFLFYGPRVLFHQGKIVMPADAIRQHEKELTYLDLPKDLSKLATPKSTKPAQPKAAPRQLDRKTLEQLQAMRRAAETPKPPPPARNLPEAPKPQPVTPPQQARVEPLPLPMPKPVPVRPSPSPSSPAIPDAPRPNFGSTPSASQSMRDLARGATSSRGASGAGGFSTSVGHTGGSGQAEILSDTMGVDFGPYINRLLMRIRAAWIPLLPEETEPPLNKEGTTLIRFRIEPDGRLSYMHLDDSTRDPAIDRAAWSSITSQGQFPPLPAEFKGPNLDLRIQFVISHKYAQER